MLLDIGVHRDLRLVQLLLDHERLCLLILVLAWPPSGCSLSCLNILSPGLISQHSREPNVAKDHYGPIYAPSPNP